MMEVKPKLWTPEVLAAWLGVDVGWVYRRTGEKGVERIPHIKLGKYVRFDPEDGEFQQWLRGHRVSGLTDRAGAHTFPAERKGRA